MDISPHLRHVPGIEKAIVDNKLDTLVLGLGPTAWLVPWIDRKILRDLRLWGAHDVHRIIPVDDLVLFDSPIHSSRLRPGTEALKITLASRPKRLWLYDGNAELWRPHLHYCMASVTKTESFFVWQNPHLHPGETAPKRFRLEWDRPHTGYISPVGCTTLAWREGCRRIGVLGVEMDNDHATHTMSPNVDVFFQAMANDAHELGGVVMNLSPITALKKFKAWKPSTSAMSPPDSGASSSVEKTSSGVT